MSNVLVVCNQKGGVGKTTTAVSLAACLAAAEKKTLLIDMDPQGNATSGISINKNDITKSIYDVLVGNASLGGVVAETPLQHLNIVPSNIDLVGVELELTQIAERERILAKALQNIRNDFDYVIIDCPPSLGLLTLNALTAADGVIIPVQCEYYAMEGMADLVRTVDLVRDNLNDRLEIVGIVLTMYDGRNNLCRQVSEEIRSHFGEKVFAAVVPRNVRLSEAPSHGLPIILYDIRSPGAVRYLEIANELMERVPLRLSSDVITGGKHDAATQGVR